MYLLNQAVLLLKQERSSFTFHYVSIKSKFNIFDAGLIKKFTFHYVSIKSKAEISVVIDNKDLHSTMYLLNLAKGEFICRYSKNLHSTMYLLNPVDVALMTM